MHFYSAQPMHLCSGVDSRHGAAHDFDGPSLGASHLAIYFRFLTTARSSTFAL
jgi:hypothetical protein